MDSSGTAERNTGNFSEPPKPDAARRSWRRRVLLAVAVLGLAGCVVVAGVLFWALRGVPWDEIADGSIAPVVVLESADGSPLMQEGP